MPTEVGACTQSIRDMKLVDAVTAAASPPLPRQEQWPEEKREAAPSPTKNGENKPRAANTFFQLSGVSPPSPIPVGKQQSSCPSSATPIAFPLPRQQQGFAPTVAAATTLYAPEAAYPCYYHANGNRVGEPPMPFAFNESSRMYSGSGNPLSSQCYYYCPPTGNGSSLYWPPSQDGWAANGCQLSANYHVGGNGFAPLQPLPPPPPPPPQQQQQSQSQSQQSQGLYAMVPTSPAGVLKAYGYLVPPPPPFYSSACDSGVLSQAERFNQYYLLYMQYQQQVVEDHMLRQRQSQASMPGASQTCPAWHPDRGGTAERPHWNSDGSGGSSSSTCQPPKPAQQRCPHAAMPAGGGVPSCTPPTRTPTPPLDSLFSEDNSGSSLSGGRLTPFNINTYTEDHCLLCGEEGHCYVDCPVAATGGSSTKTILCLFNEHDKHVYVMRHNDWVNEASLADVVAFVEGALHMPRAMCELWVDGRSLASMGNPARRNMVLSPRELRVKCCELRLLPGAVVFVAAPAVWDRRTFRLTNISANSVGKRTTETPAALGTSEVSSPEERPLKPAAATTEGKPRAASCSGYATPQQPSPSSLREGDDCLHVTRCGRHPHQRTSSKNKDDTDDTEEEEEEEENSASSATDAPCVVLTPPSHGGEAATPAVTSDGQVPARSHTRRTLPYLSFPRPGTSPEVANTVAVAGHHKSNDSNVVGPADLSAISVVTSSEPHSVPLIALSTALTEHTNNTEESKQSTPRALAVVHEMEDTPSHGSEGKSDSPKNGGGGGFAKEEIVRWLQVPPHPATVFTQAKIAMSKALERMNRSRYNSSEGRRRRTLYVKFLPDTMPFQSIRRLFMQFGEVLRVRVICPQQPAAAEGKAVAATGATRPATAEYYNSSHSSSHSSGALLQYSKTFYVSFVEYACTQEAELAKSCLHGKRMARGFFLAAEWCKQPISGGFRTDYDEVTGKPCTFGLTQAQIEEVNRFFGFVYSNGESASSNSRRSTSEPSAGEGRTSSPLTTQTRRSNEAQPPHLTSASPSCALTTLSTTVTPVSSQSARSLGLTAAGSSNGSTSAAKTAAARAPPPLPLFYSSSSSSSSSNRSCSGDGDDSAGVSAVNSRKERELRSLAQSVLRFFYPNGGEGGRGSVGVHRWSALEMKEAVSLRMKLRESTARYVSSAVEPLFHTALSTAYELLSSLSVPRRPQGSAQGGSAPTGATPGTSEAPPHPLLLQLETLVLEAALYIHHDGHGDGRSAARAAQRALSMVHHFARGLSQLHLLCSSRGGKRVEVTSGCCNTYTLLPQWRLLFTSVPLERQFSAEAIAAARYDGVLLPLPGDNSTINTIARSRDEKSAEDGLSSNSSSSSSSADGVPSPPQPPSVLYPRIDACCCMMEKLLQLALLLDTYTVSGTDVHQGRRSSNEASDSTNSRCEDCPPNAAKAEQQPQRSGGPIRSLGAAAGSPASPLAFPRVHRHDDHGGDAVITFSSHTNTNTSRSSAHNISFPSAASTAVFDAEDEEELQFIRRVKIELASVAEQLYRQLDGLRNSADVLLKVQDSWRSELACSVGSSLAASSGVKGNKGRVRGREGIAPDNLLAAKSFWNSLRHLIHERLPSCAVISGTGAASSRTGKDSASSHCPRHSSTGNDGVEHQSEGIAGAGVLLESLVPKVRSGQYAALLLKDISACGLL